MARDYEADYPMLTDIQRAVIGTLPMDRNMWRINWLRGLIDAIDKGDLRVTGQCDDPDAIEDCIQECRDMVRDVNAALDADAAGKKAQAYMRRAVAELQKVHKLSERDAASIMITVTSVVSLGPKSAR